MSKWVVVPEDERFRPRVYSSRVLAMAFRYRLRQFGIASVVVPAPSCVPVTHGVSEVSSYSDQEVD